MTKKNSAAISTANVHVLSMKTSGPVSMSQEMTVLMTATESPPTNCRPDPPRWEVLTFCMDPQGQTGSENNRRKEWPTFSNLFSN